MSASIFYRPIEKEDPGIHTGAPSYFIGCIEKVFGSLPYIFNKDDVKALRAMAIATNNADAKNPFEQLADVIDKHGEVEVYAEY